MNKFGISLSIIALGITVLFAVDACLPVEGKTKSQAAGDFVCMPCGRDCDKQSYSQKGNCSHCNMQLVEKSTVVFDNIAPAGICNYIAANPGVVLLDVRTG